MTIFPSLVISTRSTSQPASFAALIAAATSRCRKVVGPRDTELFRLLSLFQGGTPCGDRFGIGFRGVPRRRAFAHSLAHCFEPRREFFPEAAALLGCPALARRQLAGVILAGVAEIP